MHLDQIEQEAWGQNQWQVIAYVKTHTGGDGKVPHGVLIVKRNRSPLGEGREYATVGWNEHTSGVLFESGNYDLTMEDAIDDFIDRFRSQLHV